MDIRVWELDPVTRPEDATKIIYTAQEDVDIETLRVTNVDSTASLINVIVKFGKTTVNVNPKNMDLLVGSTYVDDELGLKAGMNLIVNCNKLTDVYLRTKPMLIPVVETPEVEETTSTVPEETTTGIP